MRFTRSVRDLVARVGGGAAVEDGLEWGSVVHAGAVVRAVVIVDFQIEIQALRHLVDGLEPGAAGFDAEMLLQERSVEALDGAVVLESLEQDGAVLDVVEPEEETAIASGRVAAEPTVISVFLDLDCPGADLKLDRLQTLMLPQTELLIVLPRLRPRRWRSLWFLWPRSLW